MKTSDKFESYPEYQKLNQLISQLDSNAHPRIVITSRSSQPICHPGKKLGIFSGSFNPITIAHIKMIEDAQRKFQLDEMLLLLAKVNVDKDVFGLPLAGRILTLNRYAEERKYVSVGVSSHGRYIDKVEALNEIFPDKTEFHFIVGYDTLIRIFDPKYYSDIHSDLHHLFSQCRFIASNRGNVDIDTIKQFLKDPSLKSYSSSVKFLILPDFYANVSSTHVRELILDGKDISHLVPTFLTEFL
ncbi:MAG: nicotinate-nicotinamide nucleotide adenylyltransferase [Candidatus Poribacteria bacterium]|nr:nicotinate-nicotinamide nucleotide adenylyltransferase [Candidatus Poribacteria bacterium]